MASSQVKEEDVVRQLASEIRILEGSIGVLQSRLDIVRAASYWMRNDEGELTRAFRHICWDGCMFPNSVMTDQKTWRDILATMIAVRESHGWD